MKKIFNIILLIILFSSCKKGEYDNKLIKDANNNYYWLEHSFGDAYFIHEISKSEIDSLYKLK